jgi:3,4-dihydroxy 2-butanone 4-phosphate synthase/GTP cyclohydrolase II
MNDDGSMARRADLEQFAQKHGIKIGTIADLIHYRLATERTVVRIGERELPTVHGNFRLVTYEDVVEGGVHMALVMGKPSGDEPVLVRVHVIDPLRPCGRRLLYAEQLDALECAGKVAAEGRV